MRETKHRRGASPLADPSLIATLVELYPVELIAKWAHTSIETLNRVLEYAKQEVRS